MGQFSIAMSDRNRPPPLPDEIRRAILVELGSRSVAAVARELGVAGTSLCSALTGSAREGTKALVALRWRQRAEERSRG